MSVEGPSLVATAVTGKELEAAAVIAPIVEPEKEDQIEYPGPWKLLFVLISIYLAVFLVALDRTITVNAIPKITDEFNSIGDIGWYGSAFLLTGCSFIPIFGKIFTFYSTKWVFLCAIAFFELGSVVSAAAPTSVAFIIGRAIAGIGAAGIFSGAILILVQTVPLQKRPLYQSLFGAVFGISSIVGPLLGGALTDNVSWRWCFYINLPIGGFTVVALIFILKIHKAPASAGLSIREKIQQLDPLGTLFLLPGLICLLLGLQWGGSTYPWSNGRVIAVFVVGGVLLIAFVLVQIWKKDTATIPIRIISQRTVYSGVLYNLFAFGSMISLIYYIPIWFQVVENVSAIQSGIRLVPLVLALVVGTISGGVITRKTGYYAPPAIVASVLISIGAGLITTWKVDSTEGQWIGYQVIYGLGIGLGMMQANVGVQTVLRAVDVPVGTATIFFGQQFGGAIFVAVAQNIFSNQLVANLINLNISGLDANAIVHTGATNLRNVVPEKLLPVVLVAYNDALVHAFRLGLGCACATIIGALLLEWRNIKDGEEQGEKRGSEAAIS